MKPSQPGFFRPTWSKITLTLVYLVVIYFIWSFALSYFGLALTDLCLPNLDTQPQKGNPIDFNLSDNLDINYAIRNIFRGYCQGVTIPFSVYVLRFLLYLLLFFVAYTLACITSSVLGKKMKKQN